MAKVMRCLDADDVHYGYYMKCPACGFGHVYWTERAQANGAKWTFNGDMDKPTLRASMLAVATPDYPSGPKRCHFFVTDGKIQYCSDTSNKDYAGKTVKMEDV